MTRDGRTIALVGGGRWGRVHASNLVQLLTSRDRVLWVSQHNQDVLRKNIAQFSGDGPKFELLTRLDEALVERPAAALIVTAPDAHVAAADACLRQGIHTFVEKPLAFRLSDALSLVDAAARADLILALGVHLLSASYLRHFKSHLATRRIAAMSIRWFDPVHEMRYGETKRADYFTPLAHDLYPHLWSIVRVLAGTGVQIITSASKQPDGSISFESSAGAVKIDAQCGRGTGVRERCVRVVFEDGGTAGIDFTEEPGTATLGDAALPPDPLWGKTPRPAMAEVRDFLAQVSSPLRDREWLHLAANCLDSVTGAEALSARLA
ncbi:Predicted dehydrogenase [Bradyrhizobium lablabi]|uniref:Predicted dehydrogenase n=1 Tax=Bradyrhizobium lablabi TaxID=722472 RepID=A0A1M7BDS3_9BRAD|nr:Gfo/Idh/MocA family oxidoreductase [Bradyrhizobium lablabi]SHL53103.1 Predicted dehydrogenase [Bradyrhizobium lablabi]